jgi:hypothetical protein
MAFLNIGYRVFVNGVVTVRGVCHCGPGWAGCLAETGDRRTVGKEAGMYMYAHMHNLSRTLCIYVVGHIQCLVVCLSVTLRQSIC